MITRKIGLIGPGNIGEAILRKLSSPWFYHPRLNRCRELEGNGLGISKSFQQVLSCDIIFLCVKPNQARQLCAEIKAFLCGKSPIFISVMAGVPYDFLVQQIGTPQIVRMMVDVSIGEPYINSRIFAYTPDNLRGDITSSLEYLGRYTWIEKEETMDTITAIFGCGPAFIARFFQAYLKIALKVEIGDDAEDFTLDLFDSTIHMLNRHHSPSQIISRVASKGGATERGLHYLGVVDSALAEAINVAEERCRDIRRELLGWPGI